MTGVRSDRSRVPARRWPRAAGWRAIAWVTVVMALTSCAAGESDGGAERPAGANGVPAASGTPSGIPPPKAESPPSDPAVHPVTTVVISDDPAVVAAGARVDGTWPASLAARLGEAGAPMTVATATADGAGFVPGAASAPSFTDLVHDHVQPSTQLVVFHDTRAVGRTPAAVEEAAAAAFAAAEEAAPDAWIALVVTGVDGGTREALAAAADRAELPVTVVDGAAEGWPASPGQEELAELLEPHLTDLVAALARSGAVE